jgi:FtsH-binding integral membrane protein
MSLICLSVSMPLFYQTHAAACGICWVVNFIFAIQLVFDVEMVMDSDRGLEIDDYIPAAMIIYFDMIMLFIRLLGSGRRR